MNSILSVFITAEDCPKLSHEMPKINKALPVNEQLLADMALLGKWESKLHALLLQMLFPINNNIPELLHAYVSDIQFSPTINTVRTM